MSATNSWERRTATHFPALRCFLTAAHVVKRRFAGDGNGWQRPRHTGWEGFKTSWKKLVSRSDIDVVDITTPSNAHKDIAITAAAKRQAHLLRKAACAHACGRARCWRPRRKTMLSTRLVSTTVLPRRCSLQNMINSGKLGTIRHVRASYLQDFKSTRACAWRLQGSLRFGLARRSRGAFHRPLKVFSRRYQTVMGMQKPLSSTAQ